MLNKGSVEEYIYIYMYIYINVFNNESIICHYKLIEKH